MKLDSIEPKSIGGIKSLARDIQKARQIPYNQALIVAAQQSGYANWKAALNAQSAMSIARRNLGHPLYITAWWFNSESKIGGRETLLVRTAKPIDEMLNRQQMRVKKYIGGKRLEAPDHLVDQRRFDTQEEARHNVAGAARTLAFIEATGLKPTGSKIPDFGFLGDGFTLPGRDHYGLWVDPVTKTQIITDEPYKSRIDREGASFEERRRVWAEKFNWTVQSVDWGGMYYPDIGSRLFLTGPAAAADLISNLVRRLNALPPPASSTNWSGESGGWMDEYLSPMGQELRAKKALAKQRRRENPTPSVPRNSITYTASFGGRRSRPAAKLSLTIHRQMGRLLKQATVFGKPWTRVANNIARVRSELDDWLSLEYPRDEFTHREFVEVYYGGIANPEGYSREALEGPVPPSLLIQVKSLLLTHYPECAPLRAMVKRIDGIVARLEV